MGRIREIGLPWGRQPQEPVRPSEWALSHGIGSLLIPSLGLRDLVDGGTWTTWGTLPAVGVGQHGVNVDTTAAYGGLLLFPRVNQATAAQTHIALIETTAVSGIYAGIFACSDASATNNSLSLQRNTSDTGWDAWNSSTNLGVASPVSAAFGPSLLIMTGDSVSTYVLHEGVLTLVPNPTAFSDSRLTLFGERSGSISYATRGRLYAYAHFTTRLSADDLGALSVGTIWQHLLAPDTGRVWVPGAGGTVPDITAVSAENITATSADYRVTLDFA